MIQPITFTANSIKEPQPSENKGKDTKPILTKKGKYHDPLNHWSVKAALYSNELGAALNEIAPTVGLVLWIPTFMYMGADIYDKYKNDKDKYNPSGKRGVKRAFFQTFSTLVLPAMALLVGQKAASPFGHLLKGKISLNARDKMYNHSKHFLTQCPPDTFNNLNEFKSGLHHSLENRINSVKIEKGKTNIFRRMFKHLTGDYALLNTPKEKLNLFVDEHAKKLFEFKKDLLNNKQPKGLSSKLFNEYSKEKYWQQIYGQDYVPQALKFTLKKYEKSLMFKNKLIKTAGGIAALALLSKPIEYFTKHILMDKVINPGIDKLVHIEFNKMHVKNMLKDMENSDQNKKTLPISSDESYYD